MTTEIFGLIAAIVGSVVGGTWLVRSKLSDIEVTLKVHLSDFNELKGRVIRLEQPKKARR